MSAKPGSKAKAAKPTAAKQKVAKTLSKVKKVAATKKSAGKNKPEPNSVQVVKPKAAAIKKANEKSKAKAETEAILNNAIHHSAKPKTSASSSVVRKSSIDSKVAHDKIKSANEIRKANEMKGGALSADGGRKVIMIAPPAPPAQVLPPQKQEVHVVHHHVYHSQLPGISGPAGPILRGPGGPMFVGPDGPIHPGNRGQTVALHRQLHHPTGHVDKQSIVMNRPDYPGMIRPPAVVVPRPAPVLVRQVVAPPAVGPVVVANRPPDFIAQAMRDRLAAAMDRGI